jgi:hypothetical protein
MDAARSCEDYNKEGQQGEDEDDDEGKAMKA